MKGYFPQSRFVQISSGRQIRFYWFNLFRSLAQYQRRLTVSQPLGRHQRDLQRLLGRSRPAQLIIVFRILQNQPYFNRLEKPRSWIQHQPNYFQQLQTPSPLAFLRQFRRSAKAEFNTPVVFNFLRIQRNLTNALKHCNWATDFFIFQQDLWVLCLLPVFENQLHTSNLYGRPSRTGQDAFYTISNYLTNFSYNWVTSFTLFTPLNKHNKLYLLKTFYTEKKFLLNWFIQQENQPQHRDRLATRGDGDLSIQSLINTWLGNQLIEYFNQQGYSAFFYAPVLLVFTTRPLSQPAHTPLFYTSPVVPVRWVTIDTQLYAIQTTSIQQGFDFLGWHFSRQNQQVLTQISRSNIRSHCHELNHWLKASTRQPDDKAIIRLNQKIQLWQNYYCCANNLSTTWAFLNRWLFWRLWRWLKKRHRRHGSKWLYTHYWTLEKKLGYYCWCFQAHGVQSLDYSQGTLTYNFTSGFKNIFE